MSLIPHTTLDDNALHRASLWIERLTRAAQGPNMVGPPPAGLVLDLLGQLEVDLSAQQLWEGSGFYGRNWIAVLPLLAESPVRRAVGHDDPTTERWVMDPGDLLALVVNVWQDGWLHGAATKAGKSADADPAWETTR